MLIPLQLVLAGLGLAFIAGAAAATVVTTLFAPRHAPKSEGERLREQAEHALAMEKLEELAGVTERRRRRIEAAEQRMKEREANNGGDLTPQQVAQLPVHEQLAWASRHARHRDLAS